ncbi:hypothetical protein [Pseudonocardia broussonetiae]|uniref:DUF320 domain-containing protein n=1 Tax=Pseudonocardia broussonetiae TaxID=2736640 RepID=A0A6M6JDM8_9PSEU|nr:hypothetical protein [Pseudonocardia broussonetiae]QJY45037.1 hypothetical protein HOP40_03670 [Pseudonocardia broussonetiae]
MRLLTIGGATGLALAAVIAAAPAASAQPQEGLVNVNVEDVVLQVPIGVAANVCDLNVAVLAQLGPDEAAECDATVEQFPVAYQPDTPTGPQDGLVNVNVEDVVLQVPIGVAANVCDLDVAVLAELGPDDAADCDATIDQFPTAF